MSKDPASKLPRVGFADLRSIAPDGKQMVALRYDLSKRGNRQALIRYYEHELRNGRHATITLVGGEIQP